MEVTSDGQQIIPVTPVTEMTVLQRYHHDAAMLAWHEEGHPGWSVWEGVTSDKFKAAVDRSVPEHIGMLMYVECVVSGEVQEAWSVQSLW